MSNQDICTKIFMILAIVLISIRIVGGISKKIGQPQVVAEMITGIILGPSVIGGIFPNAFKSIFSPDIITIVYCLGQIGLVLYMFAIGLQFNINMIKNRFHNAVGVSLAGILAPFTLGGILACFIYKDLSLFSEKIILPEAILFTGSAISITAFPMLARIIYERGLSETRVGTLILASGSIDDVLAWCMLTITVASFYGKPRIALTAVIGGLLYALIVFLVVKPLLSRYSKKHEKGEGSNTKTFSLIIVLVIIGAFYTDYIGIYAVFGAFLMGIAVPRGKITEDLRKVITPIASNVFLPLFFVYSGLNTKLNLILSEKMICIVLIVTIIACMGKGIACWAAARVAKEKNSEAMIIGILMNSRGLMELILINIGLENGIITETFYAIMVAMAIITTLMTSPLFESVYKKHKNVFKQKECFRGEVI